MRLVFRPMVKTDIADALACVPESYFGDRDTSDALQSMWADLIARDSVVTACIEDLDCAFGRRIVAMAVGVITTQVIADEMAAGQWPLGALRILEASAKHRLPALVVRDVAAANAAGGVNVAVVHFGVAPDLYDHPQATPIIDRLESLLHFLISGFRLRSVLVEAFGERQLRAALAMRLVERAGVQDVLQTPGVPRVGLQPHILGLTMSEAVLLRGTSLASLFTYSAPVLGLTVAERQLLLFALGGMTDLELASHLFVSYATVRKRWDSIYAKVVISLPHVCRAEDDAAPKPGRGAEKRRRVLRYVQDHPSEMRAYPPVSFSSDQKR